MKNICQLRNILLLLPVILLVSCKLHNDHPVITGPGIKTSNGMVVSAHPRASLIGIEVLKIGGNAIDAAVATEFALAVCYPAAGNIGGGGLMVIRLSNGNYNAVDYREKAPLAVNRDLYLDDNGDVIQGLSTSTHMASGVPGTVAGVYEAHSRYGVLAFKDVIQPAIDLAGEGFQITEKQARSFNSMKRRFVERNSHNIPFVKEIPWQEGDTLIQPELSNTLCRIRDNGPSGFYKGQTADMIVREMNRGNGLITHEDLRGYSAEWRLPISTDYKDYTVISMAPPSSGGVALVQMLGMVEDYPIRSWGFHSRETIHLIAEIERRVYADRAKYLGDPDFVEIPVEELVQKQYLLDRMSTFSTAERTDSKDVSAGTIRYYESEETTHYSVTDSYGNSVSATTTLNSGYGNGIVVKDAGFFLNNEMDDFSIKPGFPNIYGLVGGEANSIQPGKRMLSSMTPTIIEKEGELYMVLGSPGGSTIITSVFQTILNVLDFGMDMQSAVDAGRFHHQWLPDLISFEENMLDPQVIKSLEDMGHTLKSRGAIGRVDAIRVLPGRLYEGGADSRGDDTAAGY